MRSFEPRRNRNRLKAIPQDSVSAKNDTEVSAIIDLLDDEIDELMNTDNEIEASDDQSMTNNDEQSITRNENSIDQSYTSISNDEEYTAILHKTAVNKKNKHKSNSSAVLSNLLSSASTTIHRFQSNDDMKKGPRSSQTFDYKEFLQKEKKTSNTLNTNTSINNHKGIQLQVKKHAKKTSRLEELLSPATPTIQSFQSNEDDPYKDLSLLDASLSSDPPLDVIDEDSDYEQDLDLLEIELADTKSGRNGSDIKCNSIKTCDAIKRMISLLNCYQKTDNSLTETLKTIEKQQNMSILNDYHHVLLHHLEANDKINKEFEFIYKEIDIECNLHECNKYQRQKQRQCADKESDENKESNEFDEEKESDENNVFYLELMDSIHCYLLHSYDTGMRSRYKKKNDSKSAKKHFKKLSNQLQDLKIDAFKDTVKNNDNNNKYYTNVESFGGFKKGKKKKKSSASFDFGYKYYYWPHYKDNEQFDSGPNAGYKKGDWYIDKKYSNLKEEILNNEIFRLSSTEFEKSKEKAQRYLHCTIAKEMRSDAAALCEYCQIKPGSEIKCDNLLAIILYTDYTNLCFHFSSTFRKIDFIERMQEMKSRNSEYANWSKLLIETVELYGINICNSEIKIFYHGVSYMTFATFLSYFCGPTSSTPQLEVAENFCGPKGLILELVAENEFSLLKYFNCQWIGAYTAEDEKLFIGGYRPLKFYSIRLMQTGENYQHYIVSLTLFDYVLNGKRLSEKDKKSKIYSKIKAKKIINCLMKHYDTTIDYKNQFHVYVNELFKTFVEKKKHISIHLDAIHEDYPFIKSHLFSKKSPNLLLFDKLAKCFRNCVKITVYSGSSSDNDMNKIYLDELSMILKTIASIKKVKISLKRIKICDVKYNNEFLDDEFTGKYSILFAGCKLLVENQTRLQKNDKQTPNKLDAKDANDVRRGNKNELAFRSRNKSSRVKIKKVGFAVDETTRKAFRRITIRSDLIINRSESLIAEIREASRAHTHIGAQRFIIEQSMNSITGISSQRPSVSFNSLYEDSFLENAAANRSMSRLFNTRESHRITAMDRDLVSQIAQLQIQRSRISQFHNDLLLQQQKSQEDNENKNEAAADEEFVASDILRQRLFTMHEEDEDEAQLLVNEESDDNDTMGIERFAFANNELTDSSILGINGFAARKFWMDSFEDDENKKFDCIHYDDLYPNIIHKFKQLTKCEHHTPNKQQLLPFFTAFNDEDDGNNDMTMKSQAFDAFYAWFKSFCRIICDFKNVYDNGKSDILCGLFYDEQKAEELLSFEQYKSGTFVLRLTNCCNELIISYKNGKNQVKHNKLIRCDENEKAAIYQIGESTKQLPITTFIRSCKLLQFLCIENNLVKNKNVYF